MTDSKLVPADDEAFRLSGSIHLSSHTESGRLVADVWVDNIGDFVTESVNLDIGYIAGSYVNTNIDMAPEDAERLGILLQFAAREVMQRRATDA